jgi:DNA polymerase-1
VGTGAPPAHDQTSTPTPAQSQLADGPQLEPLLEQITPPGSKRKAKTSEPTAALPAEADLGPLPIELLARPGDTTPLVVDLETHSADRLWQSSDGAGSFIRLTGTDHGASASPASLVDHAGPLVAHNGFGFDYMALARHHGFDLLTASESGRLIDTMVLALALDPPKPPVSGRLSGGQIARQYRLDALAERYGCPRKTEALPKLAAAYGKQQGLTGTAAVDAGYGLIPRNHPDFIDYLRADVAATRAVFDHLCPDGTLPPYGEREMRIMGRLTTGITLAGTRLDVELTQTRYEEVEARKAECRDRLIRDYGLPTHTSTGALAANPLSCNGAAEAITKAAADVGLELPTTEKTGKPSTSKDNLDPLLEQARAEGNQEQVNLLETILGLTGARSVYGTALDCLQPDGRVHPQVAPLQVSGRFSITSPGITVFGKRGGRVTERATFLPDSPDHVLVATDLSQIDMRAMAAHAQDPAYLELFQPGRDAHSEIAAAIGLSRSDAKAIGHGWNYGMSINGMVRHGIDQALAEQFDQGMRRRFPALVRWRDKIRAQAERGRRLDNGFGRMMRPNPQRAHTQAPSLIGQGCARDLMMEAVLRLPVEIVPMLRLLVHDELVFSIPLDDADRIEALILESMNFCWAPPGAKLEVPITADLAKRGQNWADCYRKG